MEQNADVEVVKAGQRQMNQQAGKFVSALLSVITGCVMLMVGFIWTLKSEFAEEKVKSSMITKTLDEVRLELKSGAEQMRRISEAQIRLDTRLESIESNTKNR